VLDADGVVDVGAGGPLGGRVGRTRGGHGLVRVVGRAAHRAAAADGEGTGELGRHAVEAGVLENHELLAQRQGELARLEPVCAGGGDLGGEVAGAGERLDPHLPGRDLGTEHVDATGRVGSGGRAGAQVGDAAGERVSSRPGRRGPGEDVVELGLHPVEVVTRGRQPLDPGRERAGVGERTGRGLGDHGEVGGRELGAEVPGGGDHGVGGAVARGDRCRGRRDHDPVQGADTGRTPGGVEPDQVGGVSVGRGFQGRELVGGRAQAGEPVGVGTRLLETAALRGLRLAGPARGGAARGGLVGGLCDHLVEPRGQVGEGRGRRVRPCRVRRHRPPPRRG
jgi:hypothetical protein